MSAAFAFGFGGDDIGIDEDGNESGLTDEHQRVAQTKRETPGQPDQEIQEAQKIGLDEIFSSLPSQISFNNLSISDPSLRPSTIRIPRRDVFDIRAQLMAEDDSEENANERLISGLETGDITPAVYEGGFKTWESAIDLSTTAITKYGSSLENGTHDLEFIELGAGTAIPSLVFLRLFLRNQRSADGTTQPPKRKINFTFADYNAAVLKLVTFPNILLTWYTCCKNPTAEALSELEIDSSLLDSFRHDLSTRGITLSFISGGWSPCFVDLVASESSPTNQINTQETFILASETIYSPASIRPFAETVTALMRRKTGFGSDSAQDKATARALVAAKKVYFGVGGGVDEFLETLKGVAGENLQVRQLNDIGDQGVVRVVLEITV
ncbi:conserved hypothetical protein [Uncinocarpus reesii 1704]|uniref:protein-histidine N-methyltransferase n=1 Tax=Uncinocarpus reesii (strain UAMH 1704) TaxID=336963 RepID=C4JIG6_UNCRE|nr:uncharacterized protein UREG_01503 [Uncinocarpus reesii 1704]EEP76654.1 conserved hypothetical protein [Uncinocarpus reesii 1704]